MKKISTKSDCEHLEGLPPPVIAEIEKNVAMLNFYYGESRNPDTDLGGYVLLIENAKELKNLKKRTNLWTMSFERSNSLW